MNSEGKTSYANYKALNASQTRRFSTIQNYFYLNSV
jgi:hypothetical protein